MIRMLALYVYPLMSTEDLGMRISFGLCLFAMRIARSTKSEGVLVAFPTLHSEQQGTQFFLTYPTLG